MNLNKLNKMQLLIFALIISLAIPLHQALGGAWPQKKGTGYYKLDFRYMSSNKTYNSNGDKYQSILRKSLQKYSKAS